MLCLQVNDVAFSLRLIIFGSKVPVQLLYTQITEQTGGGGGDRGEGVTPSDLLCWLTFIWSGAPTDPLVRYLILKFLCVGEGGGGGGVVMER